MTTQERLAELVCDILIERQEQMQFTLNISDLGILMDTINTLVPRMITKFINGAKEHGGILIENTSFDALTDEHIDGLFYTAALKQKHQQLTKYILCQKTK